MPLESQSKAHVSDSNAPSAAVEFKMTAMAEMCAVSAGAGKTFVARKPGSVTEASVPALSHLPAIDLSDEKDPGSVPRYLPFSFTSLCSFMPPGKSEQLDASGVARPHGPDDNGERSSLRYGVPTAPPGIDHIDYLVTARSVSFEYDEKYGHNSLPSMAAKILWYYENEKSHAPNDIKNLSACKGNKYGENFGNWLAGAVGECLDLPKWMLTAGAGLYQVYSGTSDWSYISTFFDDPRDFHFIENGADWARSSINRIDRYLDRKRIRITARLVETLHDLPTL